MRYIFLVMSFFTLFFSGCMTKQDYTLASGKKTEVNISELAQDPSMYKIRRGDRLSFVVANNPQASSRQPGIAPVDDLGYLVNSRGTISVPLVGPVEIEGLTICEATIGITEALKQYIKNPQVNLELINPKIFIVGEVNKPGVHKVDRFGISLLEALAYAEDFSYYADRSSVKIIRGNPKNPEVYEIDATKMASLQAATIIFPNDIIYIEPNGLKVINNNLSQILLGLTGSIYYFDNVITRKTRF